MADYLVTGGAGFIGSHLCDVLIEQGNSVTVLDDLSTGKIENINQKAVFVKGNTKDKKTVRKLLKNKDGCFHLAAIASVVKSTEEWLDCHNINLAAAINIMETIKELYTERPIPFVYASSAAVYGDKEDVPVTESMKISPITAYGADKLGCELHAKVAGKVHNIPTLGCRFFNVYGTRQDPLSPYSGVISIFINNIIKEGKITIFGDGNQSRDFISVKDVVSFLIKGMEKASTEAPVYNVCTGKEITVKKLAEIIADIVGRKIEIENLPAKTGDIYRSLGSPELAFKQLGLKAEIPLDEGLKEVVSYMKS